MSIELQCVYCGKNFTAKSRRAKYCSKKCHDTVFRLNHGIKCNPNVEPYHKICECCGKPFSTYRQAKITCSHECAIRHKKTKNNPIKKICPICKAEFKTFWDSQKTCGSEICKAEYKRQAHKKRNNNEKAIAYQEKKRAEKKKYRLLHTEKRECKICGTLFYCLDTETIQTCSSDCSKEYKKQKNRAKTDKRLNKNNIIDSDITLEKLYKRDNGICYLCGRICDWSDYLMRGNIKICGGNYPSKDHVIPLARGGKHQWENVRLAHLSCNIAKSDTTPTYTKEMSREHARKYASLMASNKKQTAQYTLDGNLLKIWDSTAEIERELGLNSKHIQNVCRNSKTGNAYGYRWEYVS